MSNRCPRGTNVQRNICPSGTNVQGDKCPRVTDVQAEQMSKGTNVHGYKFPRGTNVQVNRCQVRGKLARGTYVTTPHGKNKEHLLIQILHI